jgi:hypothetical protein
MQFQRPSNFLPNLHFNPEGGGSMFLQNVCNPEDLTLNHIYIVVLRATTPCLTAAFPTARRVLNGRFTTQPSWHKRV